MLDLDGTKRLWERPKYCMWVHPPDRTVSSAAENITQDAAFLRLDGSSNVTATVVLSFLEENKQITKWWREEKKLQITVRTQQQRFDSETRWQERWDFGDIQHSDDSKESGMRSLFLSINSSIPASEELYLSLSCVWQARHHCAEFRYKLVPQYWSASKTAFSQSWCYRFFSPMRAREVPFFFLPHGQLLNRVLVSGKRKLCDRNWDLRGWGGVLYGSSHSLETDFAMIMQYTIHVTGPPADRKVKGHAGPRRTYIKSHVQLCMACRRPCSRYSLANRSASCRIPTRTEIVWNLREYCLSINMLMQDEFADRK